MGVFRRLLAVFVALLAFVATAQASATTLVCKAEAQARACHCNHAAMQSMAEDDCCNGQQQATQSAASFALLVPPPSAVSGGSWLARQGEIPAVADVFLAPGYAHDAPARAPPVPRFLAFRTLLI